MAERFRIIAGDTLINLWLRTAFGRFCTTTVVFPRFIRSIFLKHSRAHVTAAAKLVSETNWSAPVRGARVRGGHWSEPSRARGQLPVSLTQTITQSVGHLCAYYCYSYYYYCSYYTSVSVYTLEDRHCVSDDDFSITVVQLSRRRVVNYRNGRFIWRLRTDNNHISVQYCGLCTVYEQRIVAVVRPLL